MTYCEICDQDHDGPASDADTCCDHYAIEHPGVPFCPACESVNSASYPSSAGIRGAQ